MQIALVNMPFSSLLIPSIALHQLREVIQEQCDNTVSTNIYYLNHDIGAALGEELYGWISESLAGHTCGFGEWFFRQVAFPEQKDNTDEYFSRYRTHFGDQQVERYYRDVAPIRAKLDELIDGLIAQYNLLEADVVGLTSMFFQNVPSFAMAKRLRTLGSKATIVMGGANCEASMGVEIVNHVDAIDYVFSGHALESFPLFIKALQASDTHALSGIDGVYSRANSMSVSQSLAVSDTESASLKARLQGIGVNGKERTLDRSLPLDYGTYLNSYDAKIGPVEDADIELLFETSRGCWWGEKAHCTFCGLNGDSMNFREMGVAQAKQTIESMVNTYQDRVRRFASVDNIVPKPYADELFPQLDMPDDVVLFYEVKADLSRDQLQNLAAARVMEVQPGVESLSTSTLKLMAKGATAFGNLRFLADCRSFWIKPIWNLLVGFPGEASETYVMYLENIPRLTHLPPPSGVFPVRFDRFSPYFNQKDTYELDLEPLDYNDLIYPFSKDVLYNMAYYFRDANIGAAYQVDLAQSFGALRDNVLQWQARWQDKPEKRPALRLIEDAYGWLIEDSRSGHMIEYELSDDDVELLRFLGKPQPITKAMEFDAESYEYLMDRGLLFVERTRAMSLVFEGLRYQLDTSGKAFSQGVGRAEAAARGLTI